MNHRQEPKHCTSIVNDMPRESIRELLELAEKAPINIVSTPKAGLNMMHVLDAFDSEFLLGEVLVSSAEVTLDGNRGFGMVTGDEPERSLARACAEVLLVGNDELLKNRVKNLLERERQELRELRRHEEQLIAGTKVSFN
ncbi:phosphonate C-P lyase system protein PhnG [uncultured Desulfuromusa sp.]|uniref:phosphonate C-P lyase system protein PhnG n=1 Tax=uncultured Desulfuromusa sp. TaxID=219183 RepID=UPI002AA6C8FF|nr:phosphonate C-P lyase system protein PhnG [uncultured Desulfuromusa sp.]